MNPKEMTTRTICGPSCKCSKHTDTPRADAFGNNLVKCYCPRCIVGVHDDIQLAAQYRAHAEWKERAEKAEAEVERLKALLQEARPVLRHTAMYCLDAVNCICGTEYLEERIDEALNPTEK